MARRRPIPADRGRPRRPRLLGVLALVWAVLATVLFVWTGRFSLAAVATACGQPAPDVVFAPSQDVIGSFVAGCGDAGLAAYRDLQVVDLAYPAISALLLIALLRLALRGAGLRDVPGWCIVVVPVLAAAGDYVENAIAWAFIAGSGTSETLARVLQAGSAVKGVASWAAWVTLIVAGLAALLRRFRPRNSTMATSLVSRNRTR